MRLTRRRTLLLGAAAGAAALGGAAIRGVGRGGITAHALAIIDRVYGPDVAARDAAREFAQTYEDFVLDKGLSGLVLNAWYRLGLDHVPIMSNRIAAIEASVIDKFATSTNVVLAYETGVPLVFVGLFQPYLSPCTNQLAAQAIS